MYFLFHNIIDNKMARLRRLKVIGEDAYYHVISRTVGQEFLLGKKEKNKFVEMIEKLSKLFLVKIIGYSIMSNHFHLLIKIESSENFDDDNIRNRLKKHYGKNYILNNINISDNREKLSDLSVFMKTLKQSFSLWYNKKNNRKGHFWSERFKSVLIENGEGLLNCLAYIDLNSLRAKIVDIPENYKWSSIGYRINHKKSDFLSFEGVFANNNSRNIKEYLEYIYFKGDISPNESTVEYKRKFAGAFPESPGVYNSRHPVFIESGVLGSKQFVLDAYLKFGSTIFIKKGRDIFQTDFSDKIFSVRRKYEYKTH